MTLGAQEVVDCAAMLFRDARSMTVAASPSDGPQYSKFPTVGRADQFMVAFYLKPGALDLPVAEFAQKYLAPAMAKLSVSLPASSTVIDNVLELPEYLGFRALDKTGALRVVSDDLPVDEENFRPEGAAMKRWFNGRLDEFQDRLVVPVMRFDVRAVQVI